MNRERGAEYKKRNVESRAKKREPEPSTESTSAEIGSSEGLEPLQLSHVVSPVTLSPLFLLVLILNFLSFTFFFSLFPHFFPVFVKFIMSPKVH